MIKRKPGQDVTLQCSAPTDFTIRVLKWIRPDLDSEGFVYYYRDQRSYADFQNSYFHGRVELRDPEMKNGDVSLLLKNVNINDTGTYERHFIVERNGQRSNDTDVKHVSLKVENPAGQTKDGGNTDGGQGRVGLIVGLSVSGVGIVVLVFCALYCFSKNKESLRRLLRRIFVSVYALFNLSYFSVNYY